MSDERCFRGAQGILAVPGTGIPGRGDYALVIFYLPAFDDNPVGKDPPGGFMKTETHLFALGKDRFVVGGIIPFADIIN